MTAEAQHEHAVAELDGQSQGIDETATSITAIEKFMFGAPAPRRKAIRELGCRIVAQALGEDDGSG
jgi:hypothetical protein